MMTRRRRDAAATTPRRRRDAAAASTRRTRRFIRAHERAGGRVYVHCKAGHGRSAAVAYAWLVFKGRGASTPEDVYAAFARKRAIRPALWRQPSVSEVAAGFALSEYKTPAGA